MYVCQKKKMKKRASQKPELSTYLNCVKTEKQTQHREQAHFFLIELPWLRERENEVYWLPQIFFMTFYLLFLYWLKCFLFLGT